MSYSELLSIVSIFLSSIAFIFTVLNYILARQRRRDALFEVRFKFYQQVAELWVSTCKNGDPGLTDITTLLPLSQKGLFLFGKDIEQHILSMEGKRASQPFFPDEKFDKPFRRYLRL